MVFTPVDTKHGMRWWLETVHATLCEIPDRANKRMIPLNFVTKEDCIKFANDLDLPCKFID